jgi:hypothetical protein
LYNTKTKTLLLHDTTHKHRCVMTIVGGEVNIIVNCVSGKRKGGMLEGNIAVQIMRKPVQHEKQNISHPVYSSCPTHD